MRTMHAPRNRHVICEHYCQRSGSSRCRPCVLSHTPSAMLPNATSSASRSRSAIAICDAASLGGCRICSGWRGHSSAHVTRGGGSTADGSAPSLISHGAAAWHADSRGHGRLQLGPRERKASGTITGGGHIQAHDRLGGHTSRSVRLCRYQGSGPFGHYHVPPSCAGAQFQDWAYAVAQSASIIKFSKCATRAEVTNWRALPSTPERRDRIGRPILHVDDGAALVEDQGAYLAAEEAGVVTKGLSPCGGRKVVYRSLRRRQVDAISSP
jgi:hypothetical protein